VYKKQKLLKYILTMAGITIKETKDKGQGLFAAKKFQTGDEVLSEKPYVLCQFSWSRFYQYNACDYCMKSLETAEHMARRLAANYDIEIPYKEECCQVTKERKSFVKCVECGTAYCSAECLTIASEEYHQTLCLGEDVGNPDHPINKLDEAWRNMHFPPETSTIMLILRIVAMVTQSKEKEQLKEKLERFFSNVKNEEQSYSHKLLGEQFKDQLKTLHQLLLKAISVEHFPKLETLEGLQSIIALIGMNGQGIGTSSLSQYVHAIDEFSEKSLSKEEGETIDKYIDKIYDDIDKEVGQFINCEGSGLYTVQSRCNHSCDPNAEVSFKGANTSELTLVALKEIHENEEICICYLDDCQRNRSRHSRRKMLRENYLFECKCIRCEQECDQDDVTSSEDDDESDDDEMDD